MEFKPGQVVYLKSDPSIKGAVLEVLPGGAENRVRIFLEGSVQTFYASQLSVEDHPEENTRWLSPDQFHAYLTALQIRHPDLSKLYSLNAARIDFIPYQFRSVLKFIRSDRPRLLIADSVQESFEHVAKPDAYINRAVDIVRTRGKDWAVMASQALAQAGRTAWGQAILVHNPEFQGIKG